MGDENRPPVENDVERLQPAQLVADLRDLDLAQKELQDQLQIRSKTPPRNQSRDLDLALLELPYLDSEIVPHRQDAVLVKDAQEERLSWLKTFKDELKIGGKTIRIEKVTPDMVTLTDEDLVVFALRKYFRHQYAGWAPTFDKHHILDLIEGWPYTKGSIGVVEKAPHAAHIPAGTQNVSRSSGSPSPNRTRRTSQARSPGPSSSAARTGASIRAVERISSTRPEGSMPWARICSENPASLCSVWTTRGGETNVPEPGRR